MNLSILLNDKEVVLDRDAEITLNYKSYIFDHEREDASYPLTLDITANRHIFGFEDRDNHPYISREYRASVFFGPYCMITGRAIVTDIEEKSIELFISTGKNSFWGDVKNDYIDQLDLGKEIYTTRAEMLADFSASLYDNKDFIACPLVEKQAGNHYNRYNSAEEGDNGFYFPDEEYLYLIPFLRLYSVIRKIFIAYGYSISGSNNPLDEEDFKNIIIICVRKSLKNTDLFFRYKDFVPHTTTYDFLMEIERKFGITFLVNPSARTVNILSILDIKEIYNVSVIDGIQKHIIDKDEILRGIEFKDIEVTDEYLIPYKSKLQYTYGDSENADNVECVSTIVGIDTEVWVEDDIHGDPIYCARTFAALDHPETDANKLSQQIATELRFTVYRGICVESYTGSYNNQPYPLASPAGLSFTESQYSLLWDYLFKKYHKYTCEMKTGFREEHHFTAIARITDLRNIYSLFENSLIIRNRKYLCSEQQITLSLDSIKEYILKCLT